MPKLITLCLLSETEPNLCKSRKYLFTFCLKTSPELETLKRHLSDSLCSAKGNEKARCSLSSFRASSLNQRRIPSQASLGFSSIRSVKFQTSLSTISDTLLFRSLFYQSLLFPFNLALSNSMASQSTPVKFLSRFFKDPPSQARYYSFGSKKCVTARRVDMNSLESENLPCIAALRRMGWEPLLELDDLVYESYTKLFYANLGAQKDDESLKVFVKGRVIEITPSLLNHILEVPDEGDLVIPRKGELGIRGYNAAQWLLFISGGKSKTSIKGEMLSKNRKVLFYIISQIICPKKGGLSNISGFEAFLLWAVENGYKINLGYLIIKHMIHELHKEKAPLAYGMVITRIYRHCNLDLSHEEGRRVSGGNLMNAAWTKTLSYRGSKGKKAKSPRSISQKRKLPMQNESESSSESAAVEKTPKRSKGKKMESPASKKRKQQPEPETETSSESEQTPQPKSKGIEIREGLPSFPRRSRYLDSSSKSKEISQETEEEQEKMLRKHVKQLQRASAEGSSRRSSRLRTSRTSFSSGAKSNRPEDPILIEEETDSEKETSASEEVPLITPLRVAMRARRKQAVVETTSEEKVSSEGETDIESSSSSQRKSTEEKLETEHVSEEVESPDLPIEETGPLAIIMHEESSVGKEQSREKLKEQASDSQAPESADEILQQILQELADSKAAEEESLSESVQKEQPGSCHLIESATERAEDFLGKSVDSDAEPLLTLSNQIEPCDLDDLSPLKPPKHKPSTSFHEDLQWATSTFGFLYPFLPDKLPLVINLSELFNYAEPATPQPLPITLEPHHLTSPPLPIQSAQSQPAAEPSVIHHPTHDLAEERVENLENQVKHLQEEVIRLKDEIDKLKEHVEHLPTQIGSAIQEALSKTGKP